jgi:hypothetical protein
MPTYWPTDSALANLKHWIEPSLVEANLDQLIPNNPAIAAVRDMMGTGDYAQATAGLRPLYKTNSRFGRGVMDFDGTDDLLQGVDLDSILTNPASGHMIAAFLPRDITTLQDIWTDITERVSMRISGGNFQARNVSTSAATANRSFNGEEDLWHVGAWEHSAGDVRAYLDDPDNVSGGVASGNTDPLSFITLSGDTNPFNGLFGAGAIWNAAPASQDERYKRWFYFLERWLARRDPLEISRERASRFLRLRSRPRGFVDMRTDLRSLDCGPGSTVALSHLRGPHPFGVGWTRSDRRPLRKLSQKYRPDAGEVALRLAETMEVAALFGDSGQARRSSDPKREGVVIDGYSAAYEFFRIGNAWVRDPGDLRVVQVPPGIIRVERTPICWAADPDRLVSGIIMEHFITQHLARSSFVNGLTGISQTPGTGGTIAVDTVAPLLFDVAITANSVKLTSGTTDCFIGWPATTTSFAANSKLCFSVDYRCDSGHAPSYQLVRNFDGRFWNDSTQTWDVANTWNTLTVPASSLTIFRGRSKCIDTGANATTVTARFGFPGTTASRIAHVYHGQLESPSGFPTSRVVTTTAELAREVELLSRPNPTGRRAWGNNEGTLLCKYTPLFSRQNLVDAGGSAQFLPALVNVHHSVVTASTGHGWFLHYEPSAGSNGQFQFYGSNAGGGSGPPRANFELAVVAGQTYRIACRWIGTSVTMYVDGVEGTPATINGTPTESDDSMLYVGGRNACDGYLERVEVKPRAMHPEWIKAWGA